MKALGSRVCGAAALACLGAPPCAAFLGLGDAAFVTVVANPADEAHWVSELADLTRQLAAVEATLEHVAALRSYAGDPRAAAAGVGSLQPILQAVVGVNAGGATAADLADGWNAQTPEQRNSATVVLLGRTGAGANGTMQVFGQAQSRDLSQYAALAARQDATAQVRIQIGEEQAARSAMTEALVQAWRDYPGAQTESEKQAILTKIQQLQAQSQLLDGRRRALLDDLALADRQDQTQAQVGARAADESAVAESSALAADATARLDAAQAQRWATLQKSSTPLPTPDYADLRVWTTADAAGAGP